jgi:multidrug resistance efflux pump
MIAFFTVIYCLVIWLFFVKMKIKPNPNNVAVAVVVGIVAIGAIVILWRFSAPNSSNLVVSRYTVQLVPQVKGPITKIHAKPNVPLKKGTDLLFEIQKDIYENTYNQVSESLDAAKKNVEQLAAGIAAADAAVKRAEAAQSAAKVELEISEKSESQLAGAVSKLELQQLRQQLNAADAAVDQANATSLQAEISKQAAESTARSLEAELSNAKFNLDQCTVYAPADGFVTQWAVREGTMAVPLPLTQIGTFIDTGEVILPASFPQNTVKNMKPGDSAELTFKSHPGEVFSGSVETIVQATGEGQVEVSGTLFSASNLGSDGMLVVKFTMDDEETAKSLAIGTAGTVVVYTETGKPFHVISKVVVRMNAWMYYLNPF